MTARSKIKTFVVSIHKYGEFPLDMLRYDDASPATPQDQALIDLLNYENDTPEKDAAKEALPKQVLITLTTESRFAPTCARWASFLTKVVSCSDPTFMGKSELLTSPGVVLDAGDLRKKALKEIANAVVRLRPYAPQAPVVYDACFRCSEAGSHDEIWRREPTGFAMGVKAVLETGCVAGDISGMDNKRFVDVLQVVIDLMTSETERQVKEIYAGRRLKEAVATLKNVAGEYA